MNLRLIGICLVAAVAGGFFAWVLYGLGGGGGGGDDSTEPLPDDSRTPTILAFIPLQVEKLGRGAEGIYGVLDFGVQAQCSLEEFIAAMADAPSPGAFREVREITYNDDGTADVQVVLITESGDVEVTWRLSFLPNGLPKIVEIPGSEECAPA
jgi:hypothetical protein